MTPRAIYSRFKLKVQYNHPVVYKSGIKKCINYIVVPRSKKKGLK